jgi:hypothetical protein
LEIHRGREWSLPLGIFAIPLGRVGGRLGLATRWRRSSHRDGARTKSLFHGDLLAVSATFRIGCGDETNIKLPQIRSRHETVLRETV